MEIQIGDDEPKTSGITNPEMYYYALGVFEEGQRHNDRVARERREKEQMNVVQAKNNTEISPVVIFIVLIIALIMCIN
jgi:hypothetical protein